MDIGYIQRWLKSGLQVRSCSFPVNEWRAYAAVEEHRAIDFQFSGEKHVQKEPAASLQTLVWR